MDQKEQFDLGIELQGSSFSTDDWCASQIQASEVLQQYHDLLHNAWSNIAIHSSFPNMRGQPTFTSSS